MKIDLLKRLVRAISDASPEDVSKVARKIVASKREAGQVKLADELDAVLNRSKTVQPILGRQEALKELPVSRRDHVELAAITPRNELEHTMVLTPSVEARFARVEQEFAARERLGIYGLKPSKKILLYGPPGCGKSLGAKRLAWNTGLPLMKVKFDVLLSSYFGESLSNLRSVFNAAKQHPCVLLLDECDFIAKSRAGSKDIGEVSRIVNMLLQLMEEYEAPGLLVATTNLQDSLDEALFRRFDEAFKIPLPCAPEIERLVRLTLAGVSVSASLSWEGITEQFDGLSAAQIVKITKNAAKAMVLSNRKVFEQSLLEKAIQEARLQPPE